MREAEIDAAEIEAGHDRSADVRQHRTRERDRGLDERRRLVAQHRAGEAVGNPVAVLVVRLEVADDDAVEEHVPREGQRGTGGAEFVEQAGAQGRVLAGEDAVDGDLRVVAAERVDHAHAAWQLVHREPLLAAEADAGGDLEILEHDGAENEGDVGHWGFRDCVGGD